jgi:hypothetical protein
MKKMNIDEIFLYIFLPLVALAINGLAIYHLLRFGSLTAISTRLILFLHVSIFIENFGNLPFNINENDMTCNVVGFIPYYGALSNVMCITLLTTVYFNFAFEKSDRNKLVKRFAFPIAFIFPFITLLPITTGSYVTAEYWCMLSHYSKRGETWTFCILYGWVLLALIYYSIVFSYTLYHSFSEKVMSKNLLSTVGVYIALSWIALIPNLIFRIVWLFDHFQPNNSLKGFLQTTDFITGISYGLCFAYNYSLFMKHERDSAFTDSSSMPITFATFEEALSDIQDDDNDTNDNDSGTDYISNLNTSLFHSAKGPRTRKSDDIMNVSANSADEHGNDLIRAYLQKANHYHVIEQGQKGTNEDELETPNLINKRRSSTSNVMEVGRHSFDSEQNNP